MLEQVIKVIKQKQSIFLLLILFAGAAFAHLMLRSPKKTDFSKLPSFFNQSTHFSPIKIHSFSSANIPLIDIVIENHTIPVKIDLGWNGGVALPRGTLETLNNKSFVSKKSCVGIRGKIYETDEYELPEICIGNATIFPMRAEEEHPEFVKDSKLKKCDEQVSKKILGRIGWRAFKAFGGLLLDCNHSLIIGCDSLDTLKQQGYPVDGFIEASLLLDRENLDVEIVTDAGLLRCTLDTGATWNMLNKDIKNPNQDHRLLDLAHLDQRLPGFNPKNEDLLIANVKDEWDTSTLRIAGKEFGPATFSVIRSPLDFDSIFGMEFIEDHLIFIDFRNQKVYFSLSPEERSLFTRAYDFIKNL